MIQFWSKSKESNLTWLFISHSPFCEVTKYFILVKGLSLTNVYRIKSILQPLSNQIRLSMLRSQNFVVFCHANSESTLAHYYETGDRTTKILIEDSWWNIFSTGKNILYFHVCNGARVIRESVELKKHFQHVISYEKRAISIVTNSRELKRVSEKFFKLFEKNFLNETSVNNTFNLIHGYYEDMLYEADNCMSNESESYSLLCILANDSLRNLTIVY